MEDLWGNPVDTNTDLEMRLFRNKAFFKPQTPSFAQLKYKWNEQRNTFTGVLSISLACLYFVRHFVAWASIFV